MPVEAVTRSSPRQRCDTHIARVETQIEPTTNGLATLSAERPVDSGLQLILPVPADSKLRPGKLVDVNLATNVFPIIQSFTC